MGGLKRLAVLALVTIGAGLLVALAGGQPAQASTRILAGLVAMQPWTAITIALSAPLGLCRFLRQTWDTP